MTGKPAHHDEARWRKVEAGELVVTKAAADVLTTSAPVGSCVAVCLWDPTSGVGDSWRTAEVAFYVRFNGRMDRVTSGVREALGPTGVAMPIVTLTTMDSLLAMITALSRMLTSLLAAFGIGALLIATLGQYSVVLFDMRRRVREIGVRLALGASPRRIQSSVIREGARLSIIGLVLGGALSLVVGRLIGGLLYGVSAIDAITYLSVTVVLTVTTLAACAIPARLASRVDPLRALREE